MATPNDRGSKSTGSRQESGDGTAITTSQAAGGGTTGDLMCFLWITFTASNIASNNNGYTQQWENVINNARVSLWTKEHDGSEGGNMTWTADTGYDDMGFISFSIFNHHSTLPIAGTAFASDTSGNVYTCPAVTQDGTTELLKVRILAADDQDVRGDDNSTAWTEVQITAGDTATGGAMTVTESGGSTSPVNSYNMDTTSGGGGTSAAQTITLVFAGADAYPAADVVGENFHIQLGAAF